MRPRITVTKTESGSAQVVVSGGWEVDTVDKVIQIAIGRDRILVATVDSVGAGEIPDPKAGAAVVSPGWILAGLVDVGREILPFPRTVGDERIGRVGSAIG